jgi:hypothetical protein
MQALVRLACAVGKRLVSSAQFELQRMQCSSCRRLRFLDTAVMCVCTTIVYSVHTHMLCHLALVHSSRARCLRVGSWAIASVEHSRLALSNIIDFGLPHQLSYFALLDIIGAALRR